MTCCKIGLILTLTLPLTLATFAQGALKLKDEKMTLVSTGTLQDLVNQAAHTALTKFADKKLTENQLSITLIDLRDPQQLAEGISRVFVNGVEVWRAGAVTGAKPGRPIRIQDAGDRSRRQ